MTRALALLRHELRVHSRDQAVYVVFIAMPLLLVAFIRPTFRVVLESAGYRDVTGAEHVVPGMAAMFSFFMVGTVGLAFFRERGWGTWQRLRATALSPVQIIAAKVGPVFALAVMQQLVLLAAGVLLFGMRVRGSVPALVLVALALSASIVCFGAACVSIARTLQQISVIQSLGTMLFAGFGGALTPFFLLPEWARVIGRATPSYWAIRGYTTVILDGGGLADVVPAVTVLLSLAVVFAGVAVWRLSSEEVTQAWA